MLDSFMVFCCCCFPVPLGRSPERQDSKLHGEVDTDCQVLLATHQAKHVLLGRELSMCFIFP